MQLLATPPSGPVRTATLQTTTFTNAGDTVAFDAARQSIVVNHAGGATTMSLTLSAPDAQGNTETFSTGAVNVAAGDSVSFNPSSWGTLYSATVTVTVTHSDGSKTTETLTNLPGVTASPGAQFVYDPNANTLSLTSGTLTFTQDVGNASGPPNTPLQVSASGAGSLLVIDSTEHLGSLALATGATATLANPGTGAPQRVLAVSGLNLDASAKLDLTSNPLQINYGSGQDPSATVRSLIAQNVLFSSTLPSGAALGQSDNTTAETDVVGVLPTVLSVTPQDAAGQGVAAGSGGVGQRSMETQITIVFSAPVTLAAGAFNLSVLNTDGSGASAGGGPPSPNPTDITGALGTPTNPSGDGRTWVIPIQAYTTASRVQASYATAKAAGGPGAASLNNGLYTLGVHAASVTAAGVGPAMAADFSSATFHRLFGDINGDGVVNAADNLQLKKSADDLQPGVRLQRRRDRQCGG